MTLNIEVQSFSTNDELTSQYILYLKCVLGCMEQIFFLSLYILIFIYFSSYEMVFIKHSKYEPADEVIELITYATGEGSILPAHTRILKVFEWKK